MEILNTIFSEASNKALVNVIYILASVLFISGLKMLGSAETARKGNLISALGMLIAVVVTLLDQSIVDYKWIFVGLILGSLVGVVAATKVKMTAMPEMVAIFNGFGGIASLLVGSSEYLLSAQHNIGILVPIFLTVVIGGLTFTGSLIAYGKLSGTITGNPVIYRGQQWINGVLMLVLLVLGIEMILLQGLLINMDWQILLAAVALSFLLGILIVRYYTYKLNYYFILHKMFHGASMKLLILVIKHDNQNQFTSQKCVQLTII